MDRQKTIYIADDDDNIRQAIKTFLESEGYQVEAFVAGDPLLERFQTNPCDLVILDVMMPGSSGFQICSVIRETSIVPIIMLTARDTDIDYATGLSLGSDDYFTKPFSAMALVMRVKAIFRRIEFENQRNEGTAPTNTLAAGNLLLDSKGRRILLNKQMLSLTPNEYDLLKYLMERKGEAVSRDELLENIWGYQTEVETKATDDTVRRLRKKLDQSGIVIEAVWGYGFRLTEQIAHGK